MTLINFKKSVFTLLLLMLSVPTLFAQGGVFETPVLNEIFVTFAALVGAIPFVVEMVKNPIKSWDPQVQKVTIQIISWITGIILTLIGYHLDLGYLADIELWMALIYGFGASLAANGVADTKIIEWIFSFFIKKNKA